MYEIGDIHQLQFDIRSNFVGIIHTVTNIYKLYWNWVLGRKFASLLASSDDGPSYA